MGLMYGPYEGRDGRLRVVIYNNGVTTTKSYPRLIMEEYLGYTLADDEDVHHKDGNPRNNDLNNLEIIRHSDHVRQHALNSELSEQLTVECVWCSAPICITRRELMRRQASRKGARHYGPFCSRKCSGQYGKQEQLIRDGKLNAIKFGETFPSGNAEPSPNTREGVET